MRRLPIYLLLDTSESMAGEAIEEMSRGVVSLVDYLRGDPQAIETAWISVITFSNTAKQVVPLTELMAFSLPRLSVRTGTALGAALDLLMQCIPREVKKTTTSQKGDYKPLVVLFTDGQATDDYEDAVERLRGRRELGIANIYAIGCGPDVDLAGLRSLTEIVLRMKDMSPTAWKKVFIWLSASVQSQSAALDAGREGQPLNLPALPADVLELAPKYPSTGDGQPRQVFLHARCARDGRPYLMRFARRGSTSSYVALCAHPLDEVEPVSRRDETSDINTADLEGCPACPYCGSPAACACGCGTLVCFSGDARQPFVCPACKSRGSVHLGGDGFDLRQARG